jgi:hypothetical protein
MSFSDDDLNDLYEKTDGRCHVCRKKVAFTNYGGVGARGAWEVDHSRAQARGGSSYFRNLLPACVPCNRWKGHRSTRSVRAFHGHRRAPLSRQQRQNERSRNLLLCCLAGVVLGRAAKGPAGAAAGLLVGALIGSSLEVDG